MFMIHFLHAYLYSHAYLGGAQMLSVSLSTCIAIKSGVHGWNTTVSVSLSTCMTIQSGIVGWNTTVMFHFLHA